MRRGDETVCLLREDGAFPLRSHVLHEGVRFPLGVASAGMVIEKTRTTGYSTNPGLIVEGSWGIGAAVLDGRDVPRWAVSLTGIEARIAPRQDELGQLLLRAAHALSTQVARTDRQR